MADPYTSVTVTDYNLNPPADDGSEVPSNQGTWSGVKTKIGDPLKAAVEAINTNVGAAVDKLAGGVTSVSDDYTILSSDQGKLVRETGTGKTITTPDATVVGSPFKCRVVNAHATGDLTLDGSGSQTVDGAATITIPAGRGVLLETDGANWFTGGLVARASQAEAEAGTDNVKGMTPLRVKQAIDALQANPFANELLHVRDQKTNGTGGGTCTLGSYQTRTLNTEVTNEITGASLATNQITLPAGTYFIDATCPFTGLSANNGWFTAKAKLRNVTDGSDTIIGTNASIEQASNDGMGGLCTVRGRFTIAAEKAFELQQRIGAETSATFGAAASFSDIEVYADVMIWKIG